MIPSPASLVISLTSSSGFWLCAICNATDHLFFFFHKNWQCGWHKKLGWSYEIRVLPELHSQEKNQKGNSEATKPFFRNILHKCLQNFYFHLTQLQIPKQVKVNFWGKEGHLKRSDFLQSEIFLSFLDSKLATVSFSKDPQKTPARLFLHLWTIKMLCVC